MLGVRNAKGGRCRDKRVREREAGQIKKFGAEISRGIKDA